MNVSVAHSGNAASHEIPDSYPAVVAADGQQSTASVECTCEGLAARIQNPVIMLQKQVSVNALYMRHISISGCTMAIESFHELNFCTFVPFLPSYVLLPSFSLKY